MTFSKEAKLQVLKENIESDCCGLTFLCGILFSSGQIEKTKEKTTLYVLTDIQELYNFVNSIIKNLYGEYAELEIADDYRLNKITYYKITFPEDIAQRLLIDTGYLELIEGNLSANQTIPDRMIIEECCKKSFVKGAFVGSATSSIVIGKEASQKTSTGYHLEFNSRNHTFLSSISNILAQYDVFTKIIERKNTFTMYVKEANQICDLLAFVGAYDCVLELNNEIIAREMRNKVNRQTNCESANITKTVEASMRQTEAIKKIIEILGIENLPSDLQTVALLRLANPEESLEDLIKLASIKLSKGTLNHKFKKLEKIAENL